MNKEQTLKAIEVMQAYVEGKKIQYAPCGGRWREADDPSWDWIGMDYRVKPVSKPSINWDHVHPDYNWMATDADGSTYLYKEEPFLMVRDARWTMGGDWENATIFVSLIPGDCDWKESLVQRPENV